MLAVIKTGGKQYLVKKDDVLMIEKIGQQTGQTINFEEVLLLIDENKKIEMGNPYLKNVKVQAEVLAEGKAKKVLVVKYKPKVRYHKKRGHRQPYSKIKITEISQGK